MWMRDRFYSTADLSRMCGVSISTIKRWTDAGLLRCVRTPGGHRKFRVQDVAEAARRLGIDMAGVDEPARPAPGRAQGGAGYGFPAHDVTSSAARFDELAFLLLQGNTLGLAARVAANLEHGDGLAVRRVLLDVHRHGMPLADVADGVLRTALDTLRERARRDEVDSFVLRRAEQLATSAVWHLLEQLPPPPGAAPTALVATALGLPDPLVRSLACLVLAELDWRVLDLGPEVPLTVLERGLTSESPALAVLLLRGGSALDLSALRAHATAHGTELVVLDCQEGGGDLSRVRDRARERRLAASFA
jgi:excisionase family DNA binding protein